MGIDRFALRRPELNRAARVSKRPAGARFVGRTDGQPHAFSQQRMHFTHVLTNTRSVSSASNTAAASGTRTSRNCRRSGTPSCPAAHFPCETRAFRSQVGRLRVEHVEMVEQEIGGRLGQHVDVGGRAPCRIRSATRANRPDSRGGCPRGRASTPCASRRRCRIAREAGLRHRAHHDDVVEFGGARPSERRRLVRLVDHARLCRAAATIRSTSASSYSVPVGLFGYAR